jgi:GTP-binding protein HflX
VSALTGAGLDDLACAVSDALSRGFVEVDVETSVSNGKLMAYLAASGEVLSKRYSDDRVTIHCRVSPKYLGRLGDDAVVSERNGNGAPTFSTDAPHDTGTGATHS